MYSMKQDKVQPLSQNKLDDPCHCLFYDYDRLIVHYPLHIYKYWDNIKHRSIQLSQCGQAMFCYLYYLN